MNREAPPRNGGGEQAPHDHERRHAAARTGSLTRRMIGVAALWIIVLLLIGGFALDRVLTSSIVDNFDSQLELRPQRDDRRRPKSARRRSPLQPPAGRPALHRALFGPLFPDQRRGRPDHLSLALAVGPPPARSMAARWTSSRTFTTATNFHRRRAAADRRARRDPARVRSQLALPGRASRARPSTSKSASCARR